MSGDKKRRYTGMAHVNFVDLGAIGPNGNHR